jgi:hypothetical protein
MKMSRQLKRQARLCELARADVTQITPSPVSAMPAAFDTLLSEQELFDLLAYLRTPPH